VPGQVALVGSEFQINSYTPLAQFAPDVSGVGSGFVVVWSSPHDGDSQGVFGSRFSSTGARVGVEFQATLYTTASQFDAHVAGLGSSFVVTWTSNGQDGNEYGVFARRFGSNGNPIGAEFQVAVRTLGDQENASVAGDGAGGFVVVWESLGDYHYGGVFGQRFSSSGTRLGEQFQVNTYFTDRQFAPEVAEASPGFVVVWDSSLQDGSDGGVFGQRFDSSGTRLGEEFLINNITLGDQSGPMIASSDTGFVVVWRGDDGSGPGVFGRRFDEAGTAPASEVRINADIAFAQSAPDVAGRAGSYLVVWDIEEVVARRLDGLGFPDGLDARVNAYTSEYQIRPSVARLDGSGFVVVWISDEQDGSSYGIFGRRVAVLADLDVDGNGAVDPLTDGLLGLRYMFGFRGATLITGAVGAGCTRCTAPAIETYLAGKV
jgi:hypothetical protein